MMQTKQHKISTAFVYFFVAIIMFTGIIFAAGCDSTTDDVYYTVTFVTNGGNDIDSVQVKEGEKLTAPTTPVKDGYEFVGWYTDSSLTTVYSFTQNVTGSFTLYAKWEEEEVVSSVVTQITYGGQTITLSASALYVDQSLTADQLSSYAFNSLEDCVAAAKDGTADNPTVIYLAADVYWTDDPDDEAVRGSDELIGLEIPQSYITLIGMTGNYDDVIIASNRGQNTGANGNFNTLGIGDHFSAYGVTFGNYCNVDLVYARDTSKNREKRAEGIVQAQTIIDATGVSNATERYYENCAFVSRLNCIFTTGDRAVYNGCHIECTDDSLGMGNITVFMNCDLDFYSSTPVGSGGRIMMSFLGCKITTHFEGTIDFSKHTYYYTFIDTEFYGSITGMNWVNSNTTMSADIRNIVYNNTLNGSAFDIATVYPDCSVTPDKETLLAFKVGEEYNVYNLVNCANDYDEWDPLNQKDRLMLYSSPWNIILSADSDVLMGDGTSELVISATICGYSEPYTLTWTADNDMVTLKDNKDGTVTVTGLNYDFVDTDVTITATMGNGLAKVITISVTSPTLSAPEVTSGSTSLTVSGGYASLTYALSANEVSAELNPDMSVISWYRSTNADGSGAKITATTTYEKDGSAPYTNYYITSGDVGYYLVAVITPQYKYSNAGEAVTVVTSAKITESDVTDSSVYSTDFTNLAYVDATYNEDYTAWTNTLESGFWYGGFYSPAEYAEGGKYEAKSYDYVEGEAAYTYMSGSGALANTYGFYTTTQGARLVYADSNDYTDYDITMTVNIGATKSAAQGFGSARQFFDIYFKYDATTMTGYGLRILRIDSTEAAELLAAYPDCNIDATYVSSACVFQLMSYENGVATAITSPVMSTAFLQDVTVTFTISGSTLNCSVTTTSDVPVLSSGTYPDTIPHSVSLSATLTSVNSYGGFGFQHTGTAGSGKSGNRTVISGLKVTYTKK
ncbi:MAG: InlB B-repeat-containing protein [Clostridia bacterium]|nr:InlB B-repeat-containing protein [Clostridia bacterium]